MIGGIGGRMHAVEQAASKRHLADEIARDLAKWEPPAGTSPAIAAAIRGEAQGHIDRLLAAAAVFEREVREFDDHHSRLTPGEIDSGIRKIA